MPLVVSWLAGPNGGGDTASSGVLARTGRMLPVIGQHAAWYWLITGLCWFMLASLWPYGSSSPSVPIGRCWPAAGQYWSMPAAGWWPVGHVGLSLARISLQNSTMPLSLFSSDQKVVPTLF